MKKNIIYIVCGVALLYVLVCWVDVVSHNNSDYNYSKWNMFNLLFSDDEKPVNEPTTAEYIETTTEATTEEYTTIALRVITTEQTTVTTTEITTEETTTEAPTTTEYITEYVTEAPITEEVITEAPTTESYVASDTDAPTYVYDEDVEMLAHLINGEAGATWCSDTTRYYVGSVVINRMNHPDFPDTLSGVIFQSGQYACTWDGNYDLTPSDRCYEIARDLLENGSWLPDNVVFQANFTQGSGVYDYIDGVYFCYR